MVQPFGDRGHDGVVAQVGCVVVELLLQIARVEAGEARGGDAVALTLLAVTTKTGGLGTAFAAAQCDQFAGGREGVAGVVGDRAAAGGQAGGDQQEQEGAHLLPTPGGGSGSGPGNRRRPWGLSAQG